MWPSGTSSARVDTNHLIYTDYFGQLARMMGGKLKLKDGGKP